MPPKKSLIIIAAGLLLSAAFLGRLLYEDYKLKQGPHHILSTFITTCAAELKYSDDPMHLFQKVSDALQLKEDNSVPNQISTSRKIGHESYTLTVYLKKEDALPKLSFFAILSGENEKTIGEVVSELLGTPTARAADGDEAWIWKQGAMTLRSHNGFSSIPYYILSIGDTHNELEALNEPVMPLTASMVNELAKENWYARPPNRDYGIDTVQYERTLSLPGNTAFLRGFMRVYCSQENFEGPASALYMAFPGKPSSEEWRAQVVNTLKAAGLSSTISLLDRTIKNWHEGDEISDTMENFGISLRQQPQHYIPDLTIWRRIERRAFEYKGHHTKQ